MNPRLPPSSEPTPPADDLFGWRILFQWLWYVLGAPGRHQALAAGAFVAVFGLACLALLVVPFKYQVEASLLAGYQQASALSSPSERVADAPTRAAREVLHRRENLVALLEKTDFVDRYLAKRPWAVRVKDRVFEFIRGKPRERQDLIEGLADTLEDRLWVTVRPEGTLVIGLQWWDAELARIIVDAAQESFIEARRASEVQAIGEARAIFEGQQTRLESEIAAAIETFEKKQGQLGITPPRRPRPAARGSGPDPEVARLQEALAAKQGSVAEMESIRRVRLAELQAQIAQQETIYAHDHPALVSSRRLLRSFSEPSQRVTELGEEIREIERELTRRGTRVVHAVASDPWEEARLRLDAEDPRLEFERGQLGNLLRQHSELRNRIDGLKVEQQTAEAAFRHRYRVISPAKLPRGPIKPYPLIFLVGGILGGIAFAFFICAAVDLRSGRILERWQVEDQLDLPVLAEINR